MGYERLEVLKSSDKGTVSLVYDTEQRKMLIEKRFNREIAIYQRLLSLSHPYLPKVYQVHIENGKTCVIEEYITGKCLGQVHATEKQITRWLLELCEVLQFLHSHGILHRDIKPSNLVIGTDGHIRLIDFDAAREPKPCADTDTRLLGTRGYAPPEQYGFAQTDVRTDIYALGVTFGELLGPLARKRRWKRLLKRCTALEPRHRYRSVAWIRWSVYIRRLWRWLIGPVVWSVTALYACLILVFVWLYISDDGVQEVVQSYLSVRHNVFAAVDIDHLKKQSVTLERFQGDAVPYYESIKTDSKIAYISTGYMDEGDCLIFGEFTVFYVVDTGELRYNSFICLWGVSKNGNKHCIPFEKCDRYAPAVLALYELDIFDTPLF